MVARLVGADADPLLADSLGFAAAGVRDVIVQGEIVVADRNALTIDGDALAAAARAASRRLWRRLESPPEHPFMPSFAAAAGARR